MSRTTAVAVLGVLAACGASAEPPALLPSTPEAGEWTVLAERTVQCTQQCTEQRDGWPITFQVKEWSGPTPRHLVAVEARPRRLDWELYAEYERIGDAMVLLVKLVEPGPGMPNLPSNEPLRCEVELDARPSLLHLRALRWMRNVNYKEVPQWDSIGEIIVPPADAASRR